jgi:hypothetical protein
MPSVQFVFSGGTVRIRVGALSRGRHKIAAVYRFGLRRREGGAYNKALYARRHL